MTALRIAFVAGLALGLAAPGLAADPAVETVTVRVARPATLSPAAARRTERRIADAALEACGASGYSAAEMKAATARTPCWQQSYADGIAQLRAGAATAVAALPPPAATGRP